MKQFCGVWMPEKTGFMSLKHFSLESMQMLIFLCYLPILQVKSHKKATNEHIENLKK